MPAFVGLRFGHHDLTSLRESAPGLTARQTIATPSNATAPPDNGTMAVPAPEPTTVSSEYGSDVELHSVATLSDYGSDIGLEDIDEDTILADALATIASTRSAEKNAVLPSIEFEEGECEDEDQDVDGFVHMHRPTLLRVAKSRRKSVGGTDTLRNAQSSPLREAIEVEYDERSRRAWSVPHQEAPSPTRTPKATASLADKSLSTPKAVDVAVNDDRSPLERFRTKPKKCLSVTDLVSPAWCELQYLYTLSKFGRKPRTQAMRNGSRIHQKLEDQVHSTVPIQVETKEDRFALRMWNAISGLRCLRETGLTRELEVWGVLEGQVVNGVIDELSYECPDSGFEEQYEKSCAEKEGGIVPLPGQPTIAQAFANTSSQQENTSSLERDKQIYLSDVKTRGVWSLPAGASLRPTWMQLMIYRKLLESLSLNTVDAETVFARYDLAPLAPLTPSFLEEIGGLGPGTEASSYPNLLSLWSLLITEMGLTIPPTSLSPILRAEFRFAKTGDVIGSKLTVYEIDIIDKYVSEEMDWWKGAREGKGVEVEEAFKCRICDFAEVCTWRKMKVDEATEKARLRRMGRERSAV